MSPKNVYRFPNYRKMDLELLRWYVASHYHLITASVKNRDRTVIPSFMKVIAHRSYMEGFKAEEVKALMFLTARTMKSSLLARLDLKDARQRVDDYIILTARFAADELEDNYEMLEYQVPKEALSIQKPASLDNIENIIQIIAGLENIGTDPLSTRLSREIKFKDYGVLLTLTPQDK